MVFIDINHSDVLFNAMLNLTEYFRVQTSKNLLRLANIFSSVESSLIYGARYIAPDMGTIEKEELTALHEAAHAVLNFLLPGNTPPELLSMMGFGKAKAFVKHADTNLDLSGFTRTDFINDIASSLAGMAIEEQINGEGNFQAGVLYDIEDATEIAKNMVVRFGMSSLGPINFETSKKGPNSDIPESIKMQIQDEIEKIITAAKKIADSEVEKNLDAIKAIASEALKKKILTKNEMAEIIIAHNPDAQLNADYTPF